jgi:hypothetical protein
VADTSNNRIQKFDSSGNFITKWGSYGTGNGQFKLSWGVAIDSSGNVYVSDLSNNRIQKFDSSGNFLTKWGSNGSGDGQFNFPREITIDFNNNVYVADSNNHRIQKFDSSGNFLTKWGSNGTGNGQFKYARGVATDSNNNVYITDTNNNRIQKFDSSGNFITKWGSSGSGDGQFDFSVEVTTDSNNNVYVADSYNNRLQKFSYDLQAPFNGSLLINSGDDYSTSTSVNLSVSAQDDLSGVYQMQIANDSSFTGSTWEFYQTTKTWILNPLTLGAEKRTVYIQFKDLAGNLSPVYFDEIILNASSAGAGASASPAPSSDQQVPSDQQPLDGLGGQTGAGEEPGDQIFPGETTLSQFQAQILDIQHQIIGVLNQLIGVLQEQISELIS